MAASYATPTFRFARPDSYPDWLDQISGLRAFTHIRHWRQRYSENESRLSDIALEWIVQAAENLPRGNTPNANGIKVDRRFLKLQKWAGEVC